jgi:hypothetical protein
MWRKAQICALIQKLFWELAFGGAVVAGLGVVEDFVAMSRSSRDRSVVKGAFGTSLTPSTLLEIL